MWDWISNAAGGLANLFGSGAGDAAATAVSDAPTFVADPSFTLTGNGFTDIAGNAVDGATNFNNATFSLADGGTPYSFIDPTTGDVVSGATRGSVFDVVSGEPLGFNNGSGSLVDLNGAPVHGTSFGGFSIPANGGLPGTRLMDAFNGIRPLSTAGGGGPTATISMPSIASSSADRISALPVPGVPSTPIGGIAPPPGQGNFQPVVLDSKAAAAPPILPAGLQHLFQLYEGR